MASNPKLDEFHRLTAQIKEWNANRLDLFEISQPSEDLEFFGVMRFFFQDSASKVATKCIRVSSTATTLDVLNTLVEKFRPDMRMLSLPHYSLYEVHANGEERKLAEKERPLYVQLNWGKDDREGRFLLKNEDYNKNIPIHADITDAPGTFKRKLSKREKKEQKKKEKEAKLKGKENEKQEGENVAEKLYNDMPDSGFTRTISNPEVVMRRRRQMKLEKKLAEIRSKDDQGGTLKIYGESISPDVPYKTLLLSTQDTAEYVVKETLAKYGLEKEDPADFCLIQVLVPPGSPEVPGMGPNQQFFILDEDDCPLSILMHHPPNEGTVMFQLKRRTPDMPRSRKKKKARTEPEPVHTGGIPPEHLPLLTEIDPDGSVPKKALQHRLPLDMVEVGSDRSLKMSPTFLKLLGPDILPRHSVITHYEGVVAITPADSRADTYVNNVRITQTTMLKHGMIVRFGQKHLFRFIEPLHDEKARQGAISAEAMQIRSAPPQGPGGPHMPPQQPQGVEPGHRAGPDSRGPGSDMGDSRHGSVGKPEMADSLLPAFVEYRDDMEEAFLQSCVQRVNGSALQFKLAPTYALYMAVRMRLSRPPQAPPTEREQNTVGLLNRTCMAIKYVVQDFQENGNALSFWMANASELLHFYKQDGDVARLSQVAQDDLASSVQVAFHHLVACLQRELQTVMLAFLDESTEDLSEDEALVSGFQRTGKPSIGDVLQVLTNAMSMLRRCRVNAALTIQLFSQLFHFVNMWLFNKLVTQPRLCLCTRDWGHRLKRRLGRIEIWAEKQGLELAADCHLARIIQAAHLLEAPKGSPDDILSISSTCFKLNSLQLRALLENYIPSSNEARIQPELIQRVVSVAQSTADELTRSDGRDVRLEEDPDLQLPFLLPEDGYSCDIVKGVPNGLADFLESIAHAGLCRWYPNNQSKGSWSVYMEQDPDENLRANKLGPPAGMEGRQQEPEVVFVTFNKVNGSMGLSIVAAKGEGQRERGIYIKSVVPGGGAAADGRLQAGDQLLEVDGKNLIGLTQEKAAEMMTQTGQRVTLKVAKQGAIYHGLATVLSQQSPIMQRGGQQGPPLNTGGYGGPPGPMGGPMGKPSNQQGGPGGQMKQPRPISEDVSRFGPPNGPDNSGSYDNNQAPPPGQRPINMQHGAKSSPALAPGRGPSDQYGMLPGPMAEPQRGRGPGGPMPDARSKSVSNLDQGQYGDHGRPIVASTGTLPRMPPHQQHPGPQGGPGPHQVPHQGPPMGPPPHQHPQEMNKHLSQPDLRGPPPHHREEGGDYVNYSQGGPPPQHLPQQQQFRADSRGPAPGGQADYVNQQELRQGPQGGSQGMYNQRPGGPPGDWQQQQPRGPNDSMHRPPGPGGPQGQYGGPQGQYHSLQRALDPQSTIRGQRIGPRPQQPGDPRDPRFNQPHNMPPYSPQGYPQSPQGPPPMAGPNVPPPQRPGPPPAGHMGDPRGDSTYENFPSHSQQQQRRPDMQQPVMGNKQAPMGYPGPNQQIDIRMRNHSPDLPPPPQISPHPVPDNIRNTSHENLPPPPPGGMPPSSYAGNNQSMHNRFSSPQPMAPSNQSQAYPGPQQPRGGPDQGVYTQAPSNQPHQQGGYPPRSQTAENMAAVASSNTTLSRSTLSQSTGSLTNSRPGAKQPQPELAGSKKPPPIKAKPKLNLADIRKGFAQSPWEREEKERETRKREEEMRQRRDMEIQELESKTYLSHEEQERLSRLRLDREFDKRVTEVNTRDNDDEDDDISSAARVNMLRQAKEVMERKRSSFEEEKRRQEQNRQQDLDTSQRVERRLAQFDNEREAEKVRQQRRQELRQKEQDDVLKKQREREQMRELQYARETEERNMREREEQVRMQFDRMNVSVAGGPDSANTSTAEAYSAIANRAAPAPPARNSSYAFGGAGPGQQGAGSQSNLAPYDPSNTAQNPRATPSSMMGGASKKSVSFDSNLTTEMGGRSRGNTASTGSDSSYANYQVNVGLPEADNPNSPALRGAPGGSEAVNQLFEQQYQGAGGLYGPQGQQYSGQGQYKPPVSSQNQPPMSQYPGGNNQYQPPTSAQYNPQHGPPPPSSQSYQPPSSQHQPGRPYENGPQYQPGPQYHGYQGGPPPTSTYQNGPPAQYPYTGNNESGPGNDQHRGGYNNQQSSTPNYPYTPNGGHDTPTSQGQQSTPAPRTPVQNPSATLLTNVDTPGVVGGQEVYRDPRERMLAQKQQQRGGGLSVPGSGERMSFRDKMKLFASEAGETTPQEKSKASFAQRQIDTQMKSP